LVDSFRFAGHVREHKSGPIPTAPCGRFWVGLKGGRVLGIREVLVIEELPRNRALGLSALAPLRDEPESRGSH
jgi:hypothetical protein